MRKSSLEARVREQRQYAAPAEHENPGEAAVLMTRGRDRLPRGDASWGGLVGDLRVVPPARRSRLALDCAPTLLTLATV